MARALKLAKDGTLALTEADVQRQVLDFLYAKRWRVTRTPSDKYMHVAGHWSTNLKPGHPDYVCCRCLGGVLEFFYLELKRKDAVTERGRRRAQRRFAQFAADDGFIVCLMPDGLTDPYGWFLTWYAERYT